MPKLTTEQMRSALLAFVKAAPIRKDLKPAVLSLISVLREQDMEEFLWILSRPATRWRLMGMLSASLGADRAFAALAQLHEIQEMPPGLRTGESFRMAQNSGR